MTKKDRRAGRRGSRKGKDSGEPTTDDTKRSDEGEGSKRSTSSAVELTKTVLIAAVLFIVIRTFLLQTFVITSGSMTETLLVGDFLMVNRVAYGARIPGTRTSLPGYADPERGDVVVFDPHHEPDLKLVKRLIGVSGDTLEMRDKVLFLNGEAQDEPYVRHLSKPDDFDPQMLWQADYLLPTVSRADYRPTRDNWGPIVVPSEHYFMLGDNREDSLDSRFWGFLEAWRVEGRASFIYFSYNRDSLRPFALLREIRWGRIGDGIH